MPTLVRRTRILAALECVFRWHGLPGAFAKLTPPGEAVRVGAQDGGNRNGVGWNWQWDGGPCARSPADIRQPGSFATRRFPARFAGGNTRIVSNPTGPRRAGS
jgi:hypothetical protein